MGLSTGKKCSIFSSNCWLLERGELRDVNMQWDEVPSLHLSQQNGGDIALLVLVEQVVDWQ